MLASCLTLMLKATCGRWLKNKLLQQLGFLERSAIAYDQGHKDEAIRPTAWKEDPAELREVN
jgi:hypothetical protein